MAIDWYNENEHRSYPFIENKTSMLKNSEILDCGFYLKNTDAKSVWLKSKVTAGETVTYEFTYDNCPEPLSFSAPVSNSWTCVWDENPNWFGFCVIGR